MPWTSAEPNAGFSEAEPWLPVDPAHVPLAVDLQEAEPESVLKLTRRLVALRKACPALRTGAIRRLEAPAPLLVFERGEGAEALLCAFNLGDEAAEWALPDGWRVVERVGEPMAPLSGLVAERAG